jgi:hypothetical protein
VTLRLNHAALNGDGEYHFAYWGWPTPIPPGGHVDVPVSFTNTGASSVTWQGPNGSGSHSTPFDEDKFRFNSCPTNGTTIAAGATVTAVIRVFRNPADDSSWQNSVFLTYRAGGITYTIHGSLFNQWPHNFMVARGDDLFTGPPTFPVQTLAGVPVPVTSIEVDNQDNAPDYGLLSFLTASPNFTLVRVRFTKGIASTFQLTNALDPSTWPGSTVPDYSGIAGPGYNPLLGVTARWSYGVPTRNNTTSSAPSFSGGWRQIAGARANWTGTGTPATSSFVVRELHPTPITTANILNPWFYLSYPHRDHIITVNSVPLTGIYRDGVIHLS